MRREPLWLGIDVGTQSIKAAIFDESGRSVSSSSAALSSTRHLTTHTQDPYDWIRGARLATSGAVDRLPSDRRASIAAMAVCSTSGTLAVSRDGALERAALMYDDGRALGLDAVVQDAGAELWDRLGYRIQPTWAISKLLWLSRFEGLGARTRVMHQADVVAEAAAGHPVATDWSHALKSGYDVELGRWPSDVLDSLGIEERALPRVVAPGAVLGHTSADWARETGMPQGVPVVAGMTDGCAAQLGAGALSVGDWHSVIGTTLVLKGVSAQPVHDRLGALYSHRSPTGTWLPGGASNVGAGALSTLLGDADLTELEARAEIESAAPFVGYPLVSVGERFPFVQPDAHGFLHAGGMEVSFTDAAARLPGWALLDAVFAGVACTERLCLEAAAQLGAPLTGTLSTSGGGTRSRRWLRMRASTIGVPLRVTTAEGTAGMAVLAAWACNDDTSNEALAAIAARMSSTRRLIEPDDAMTSTMAQTYADYLGLLMEKGWIGK